MTAHSLTPAQAIELRRRLDGEREAAYNEEKKRRLKKARGPIGRTAVRLFGMGDLRARDRALRRTAQNVETIMTYSGEYDSQVAAHVASEQYDGRTTTLRVEGDNDIAITAFNGEQSPSDIHGLSASIGSESFSDLLERGDTREQAYTARQLNARLNAIAVNLRSGELQHASVTDIPETDVSAKRATSKDYDLVA